MKVDIASRHCRSFLGLNIQFIKDGALHLRTLAVKKLIASHTSAHLKTRVEEILSSYNIFNDKIYTFTSDNGRNMVKLGELLQQNGVQENEEQENSDEEESNVSATFSVTTLVRCCVHTLQLIVLDAIDKSFIKPIIEKVCGYFF